MTTKKDFFKIEYEDLTLEDTVNKFDKFLKQKNIKFDNYLFLMYVLLNKCNSKKTKKLIDIFNKLKKTISLNKSSFNDKSKIYKNINEQLYYLNEKLNYQVESCFDDYFVFFQQKCSENKIRDIGVNQKQINNIKNKLEENPNLYYNNIHIYVLLINKLIKELKKVKSNPDIDNFESIHILSEFIYAINNSEVELDNKEEYKILKNKLHEENKSRIISRTKRKKVTSTFSKKENYMLEEKQYINDDIVDYTKNRIKENFDQFGVNMKPYFLGMIDPKGPIYLKDLANRKQIINIDMLNNDYVGYSLEDNKLSSGVILSIHVFSLVHINTGGDILENILRSKSNFTEEETISFKKENQKKIYPAITYKIYISRKEIYIIGVEDNIVRLNNCFDIKKYFSLMQQVSVTTTNKYSKDLDDFFNNVLKQNFSKYLMKNDMPLGKSHYSNLENELYNPYSYYNLLNQKQLVLYHIPINSNKIDKDELKYLKETVKRKTKLLANS